MYVKVKVLSGETGYPDTTDIMIVFAVNQRILIKHFPINISLNGSSDSCILQNKTKYFRLRLSYEVKKERPERHLDQKD